MNAVTTMAMEISHSFFVGLEFDDPLFMLLLSLPTDALLFKLLLADSENCFGGLYFNETLLFSFGPEIDDPNNFERLLDLKIYKLNSKIFDLSNFI